VIISHPAFSQTRSILDPIHPLDDQVQALNAGGLSFPTANTPGVPAASDDPGGPNQPEAPGLVRRGVTRCLRDQRELYLAPFQRSNLKWDVMVLAGTGVLLATDRRIERHLPGGNVIPMETFRMSLWAALVRLSPLPGAMG
jgi:hypothetical protein